MVSALCKVSIGRGLNVTHQILSVSCPLMISRNHCMFKQREQGQWTVTDNEVLYRIRLGDPNNNNTKETLDRWQDAVMSPQCLR